MHEVRVPKLNANDTTYTLAEWLVADGQQVAAGEPVAVVETSKATEELASEAAGHLQALVSAGAECHVGQVIARLHRSASAAGPPAPVAASPPPATPEAMALAGSGTAGVTDPAEPVLTAPARALIEEHGLDLAQVQTIGHRVIRREHVEVLLRDAARRDGHRRLSRIQRAVAAVVTESHRTVPAAFVAVKARVGSALALARQLSREHRCLVGLPELVVKAVAAQHAEHPLCFARPLDLATVCLAGAANVGVTLDTGGGLQVPVVHDAAGLSWHELGTMMMRYRTTAMRGSFRSDELAAGTIVVALHNDEDVTFAVPLVFPGQVCAVSLPAVQTELALDADGAIGTEAVVQLGLAYDHRVINGAGAVAFLQSLKRLLGDPERLAELGSGRTGPPGP